MAKASNGFPLGSPANPPTSTIAQYYRGDLAWAELNKDAVGLGNVNNTADADKPISAVAATELGKKVRGPTGGASTDGGVALWDGTDGRVLKDGPVPSALLITADGTLIARSLGDRFGGQWFDVRDFGYVGDNTSNPLSDYYGSLGAAQAVFPHATDLTNEIDWCAIQASVNAAEAAGGGIVYIPASDCYIDQTILIDDNGVFLLGAGRAFHQNGLPQLKADAAAQIIFHASATPASMVRFTSPTGGYPKIGGGIQGMLLNGNDRATIGLDILSRRGGVARDLTVFAATAAHIKTGCISGALGTTPYDVQFWHFECINTNAKNITGNTAYGLWLTGGQGNGGAAGGNTSFNTFINCDFQSKANHAIYLEDTDNNWFINCRAVVEDVSIGTLYSVVLCSSDQDTGGNGGYCRYNAFNNCQFASGILARSSQTSGASSHSNLVSGFSMANGSVLHTIEAVGAGSASVATIDLSTNTGKRYAMAAALDAAALAGSHEFNGIATYFAATAGARGVIPAVQFSSLAGDRTGSDVNTAQSVFGASEDAITLQAATSYEFEARYRITRAAGTTSHTTGLIFTGTSSLAALEYIAQVTSSVGGALGAVNQIWGSVAAEVVVTAANTDATEHLVISVRGTIRVTAAGTIVPQFKYSAAPGGAPTIKKGTYFALWPVGTHTGVKTGAWS